jgi:hypothetical protein
MVGRETILYRKFKTFLLITHCEESVSYKINPLTPELNPSAQRCLTRLFTGDFAS